MEVCNISPWSISWQPLNNSWIFIYCTVIERLKWYFGENPAFPSYLPNTVHIACIALLFLCFLQPFIYNCSCFCISNFFGRSCFITGKSCLRLKFLCRGRIQCLCDLKWLPSGGCSCSESLFWIKILDFIGIFWNSLVMIYALSDPVSGCCVTSMGSCCSKDLCKSFLKCTQDQKR